MQISEFKRINLKVIKNNIVIYEGAAEELPEELKKLYTKEIKIHPNLAEVIIDETMESNEIDDIEWNQKFSYSFLDIGGEKMSIKNFLKEKEKKEICINISGLDFNQIKKYLRYYEKELKDKKIMKMDFYSRIEYYEGLDE